jgi:hypothetical protein
MIKGEVDLYELERSLKKTADAFGDSNQTAIARWGVATCRRLVKETQAWGDNSKAKKKQENAILKDANRAIYAVSKPIVVKHLQSGKMSGLVINGELIIFRPNQLLKTAQDVNDWIDMHRTSRKGRVPNMNNNLKGIAAESTLRAALRERNKRAGKAKGAWIGAAQDIAKGQKEGSRITIGKNVASYAHKFSGGGSARITKSSWSPVGILTNNVPYVSNPHVLKKSAMQEALQDGAEKTLKWYKKAMNAKLKNQR